MRYPVKYVGLFRGHGPHAVRFWLIAAIILIALSATGQTKRDPSLLQGGAVDLKLPPVETDPWLPVGAEVRASTPRPEVAGRACSERAPVCVHWGEERTADAPEALAALADAYTKLIYALGLPAPLTDWAEGGNDWLDLYLAGERDEGLQVHPAATRLSLFDSSAAYCSTGAAGNWARQATLCVAEAIAWRINPATAPHIKRAYATHAWLCVGHPTNADLEQLDDLQANPQLGVATRELNGISEGSAIWFEYLDHRLGQGAPLSVSTAMLSQSATQTHPSSLEWNAEPDVFDVLRSTLENKPRKVAELLLGFGVARAFLGSRDDGSHLPTLGWAGQFGSARVDWSLKFSSLPRRVGVLRPLSPTGSVYVWLSLDQVPAGKTLGFRARWERPAAFHWALVRVDKHGREIGRMLAPFTERGSEAEQTLVNLENVAGVLVVGTSLGGVDPRHPFDPDVAPHEPHGCTVYLTAL